MQITQREVRGVIILDLEGRLVVEDGLLKFGGSSLATSDRIRGVVRIVLEQARTEPVIVVVSAFQGITNQLIDAARLAERGDPRYEHEWTAIAKRHRAAIDDLVGPRRGRR